MLRQISSVPYRNDLLWFLVCGWKVLPIMLPFLPQFHHILLSVTRSIYLVCRCWKMKHQKMQKKHPYFLEYVFFVYDRKLSNVVALISYNCIKNRAPGQMIRSNFIVCHSHCFNLAVKDFISEKRAILDKAQKVVRKLSYSIPSEMLRRLTLLRAKQENFTRWSSTL